MDGKTPAVILINPRYARNVAEAIRACSCLGIPQLWVTGNRVQDELSASGKKRLPREERMKLYKDVEVCYCDYPFDYYKKDARIVAVEIDPAAQPLTWFTHPDNAVYVFGPEDGSLSPVEKRHCTDFVYIPTKPDEDGKPVCLNLYSAVSGILVDRRLAEERGRTFNEELSEE
jgi:tRNA(Leu) C34 or U34 (ribose-2'-O)-methylase TrmL